MSLFLAIRPPETIREQIITTFQDKDIPKELWERKDDLHITLLYFQNKIPSEDKLESIKKKLKTFSFSPFMIQTKAMSYWTRKENYQILHLEIILSQELKKFQSEIVSLFPEVRKSIHAFTPHISLIRSSEISQAKVEELKNKFSDFSTEPFLVNQIHLYLGEKDFENNKRIRYRIIESLLSM